MIDYKTIEQFEPDNHIVVVPDIHGRNFWKKLLDRKPIYPIIFLGDYTDPYPNEGVSEEECYKNFLDILDFKNKYPDDITLLIGNHELHYFDEAYKCTRFSWFYYEKYKRLLEVGLDNSIFQLCKQIGNYLFIHAGILKDWYDSHKGEFLKLGNTIEEQLNKYFIVNKGAFCEISYLRWGLHNSGSPIWADIREFTSEEKLFDDNIIQIVGHTQVRSEEPVIVKNVRVLDNRNIHILQLSTGKFI